MKCLYCKQLPNQGERFCSKECYRLSRLGKPVKGRVVFKKGFTPWNKNKTKETDTRLQIVSEKNKVNNQLGICGMKGKIHNEKTKKKMQEKAIGRKHTLETRHKISAVQQGINLSEWKGYSRINYKNRTEREKFYISVRKQVLERDNYTCRLCGEKERELHVDHIQSWAEYVELRFSLDNCRTLCDRCHYKVTFDKKMPENITWGQNKKREVDLL